MSSLRTAEHQANLINLFWYRRGYYAEAEPMKIDDRFVVVSNTKNGLPVRRMS